MLTIYGDLHSGNCYKVKLLVNQLNLAHVWRHIDILAGDARTPAFLAKNPNGKIPLLETADGFILPESNAILCYLAEGSPLLPSESKAKAHVLQWLFFEQYSHEPYIAVARFIIRYLNNPPERQAELQAKQAAGNKALAVMEQQLVKTPFIAGDEYSIADIALYAYTHMAAEGGFELTPYARIQAWLERVAGQPKHATMAQMATNYG